MKTRKIIVEVICFILLMNFFYEGIYKIAYWSGFGFWVKNAPLLKSLWQELTYIIPIGEIVLALSLLNPTFRVKALYITIGALLIFIFWVMSAYLLTDRAFWPYHALWQKPTWMQKMLISLGLCWMSFTAVILSKPGSLLKNNSSSLRKMPTNAS